MNTKQLLGAIPASFLLLVSGAFAQSETPAPGDLAISEVFFNALCVDDDKGEWFEVMNISGKVLDLNGLYFQDGAFPGANGDRFFQVLPSVATLPPLNPGETFVFARKGDPGVNGGIPVVHYTYTSDGAAPADKSQVGDAQMNMGNSNVDGMHITLGAPAYLGGTVIDSVSYNPATGPIVPSDGVSFERLDMYQPCVVAGVSNSTNMAPTLLTATFGSCTPPDVGTPGTTNTLNGTPEWKLYLSYTDTAGQNTGTIKCITRLDNSAGSVTFKMSNGSPTNFYTFGYAEGASEIPLSFIVPGNPGALLLDLNTAVFAFDINDPAYYFDANGEAQLTVPFTPDPSLVGKFFFMQWLGADFNLPTPFLVSNGIRMYVTP